MERGAACFSAFRASIAMTPRDRHKACPCRYGITSIAATVLPGQTSIAESYVIPFTVSGVNSMYQVYAFSTPNSVKVPIALEELGLQYELHSVNVRKGEQKHADFVALNPNGKVPVLRDEERGFTLRSPRRSWSISRSVTARCSRRSR